MMSDHFNPLETCPMSKELVHHRTVMTVRCGPCGLLNPTFAGAPTPTKLPERGRVKPPLGAEVINIDDSPVPKAIPPAQRRRPATVVPTMPDFNLLINVSPIVRLKLAKFNPFQVNISPSASLALPGMNSRRTMVVTGHLCLIIGQLKKPIVFSRLTTSLLPF